jgi:CheY-like chemotaxis protein
MDIGNVEKVIVVITPCFQAILWPLVLVFILIFLRTPLKNFLGNMGEFTLKAGTSGLEASAKQQETKIAAEAGAALGAASVSKSDDASEGKQVLDDEKAREIANIVSQAVKPRMAQQLADASILWVDDNPSINTYERIALEALGIHATICTSTEDALEKLRLNKYQVIVSDMSRPPDLEAGYTLLEELKKRQIDTDYIIYDVSILPEQRTEARRKGAFGSTNNPGELFQLVTNAIERQQLRATIVVGESGHGKSALWISRFEELKQQAFEAEDVVQRWLMDNYPHSKSLFATAESGIKPDFIISEQDGTIIGAEVLFRHTSKFAIGDITNRYDLLKGNFSGQKLDKLIIFIVSGDKSTAEEVAERLVKSLDTVPPYVSIIIGYIYYDKFMPVRGIQSDS